MRIYAITGTMYIGISGKYDLNPKKENFCYLYKKRERERFIEDYLRFKKDDINYDNIKCYYAEMKEIEDMEKVINAI